MLVGADTSMRHLQECQSRLTPLQERFTEVGVLAKDAADLLRDFPYELNLVRINLNETRYLLRDFTQVETRVTKVKALLEDDEMFVEAHMELSTLVELRSKALGDAQQAGDRYVIDGVERHFRRVAKLESRFDSLMRQHMDATFDLARKRPSLLKQVLKVIELEEKADRNRPPERLKSYHFAFREKLRESLEKRFNAVFTNAIQTDITDALRIVEQIYDNLPIIQQVNKYFPQKYMMYEFYVGNIHRNLRTCLGNIASRPTLNSADVVNLYYWANVPYAKKLESLALVPREWPVTDTLKPAIPTYTRYLRNLMNQWSERLLQRDQVNPSYVELPKNLMTDSIVTLYKFVNQQLDLVSNTRDSYFIFEVARESTHVIHEFQMASSQLLRNQLSKLSLKYLLAMLNNSGKGREYNDELEFKIRGMLSEPERSRFEKEEKKSVEDGFEDVRLLAVTSLVEKLFDLFKESQILGKLFSKEWARLERGDNDFTPMEVVVQTLADAMEQMVQRHLCDGYVSDVAKEALDRLLQRYVQEMCSRHGYTSATVAAIERDRRLIENTFTHLIEGHSFVARRLNLLSALMTFLSTPMDDQGQFILAYNALLDDFPDLTPDLVKRFIACRADCDKAALEDIVAACRGILPSQRQFKPFFPQLFKSGVAKKLGMGGVAAAVAAATIEDKS